MLNVENRTPYPGKEGRVRLRQDNGQVIEGVLEMADDATAPGTPWNRQSGRLLQADIRTYPIAAGQTITAGDVVDVVDGQIQKTLTPQANVETVLDTLSLSNQTSVTSVGQNKAVIFIPYSIKWMCCLYDYTTENVVDTASPSAGGGNKALTSDKLSAQYVVVGTTGSDSFLGYICTISANTVSISQSYYIQDFTVGTGGTINYGKVIALSSNSFLAVYNRSGLRAKVCTVSGTSISAGTEFPLSGNTSASYISATRLPDSGTTRRVCVCYSDGGDSNKGKAVIVSIDGSNNVTWGSPVVFESSSSPLVASISVTYNEENVVVCYSTTNNYVFVKTLSSSDLSEISNLELGSEFRANSNTLTSVQLGKTTIVTVGPSNSIALVINDSSSGLSIGGNFVFNSSLSQYISMVAVSSTEVILAYLDTGNSSYGTATILTVLGNRIAGSFLDSSKDAVALQSGTAGQNIEVIYSGTVYADWVTEGQIITSAGVYGVGVLDKVLQVWSKDRPQYTKIERGSYIGTGKYGAANANSISFDTLPDFVAFVFRVTAGGYIQGPGSGSYCIAWIPVFALTEEFSQKSAYPSLSSGSATYWRVTGSTLEFYGNNDVDGQANQSGMTYHYVAIWL